MKNLRKYGTEPYSVAVVHGGPGAAGEVASLAKELSNISGTLEPLQTALSVDGQVEELRETLIKSTDIPVTLVGHSWGAWLVYILAARYPELVKKVILVGSGPFEQKYVSGMMELRMSRLTEEERKEIENLAQVLNNSSTENRDSIFSRLGKLISKSDYFEPIEEDGEIEVICREDIYESVWGEAAQLRRSGELLGMGKKINCPVIAIHGDYDPHPAEGVRTPLSKILDDFRFILLEKCGHKPWVERHAKDRFYEILKNELL